jgi:hypothetical protein
LSKRELKLKHKRRPKKKGENEMKRKRGSKSKDGVMPSNTVEVLHHHNNKPK